MDYNGRITALEQRMHEQAVHFEELKTLVEKNNLKLEQNNTNLADFITLGQALKFSLKFGAMLEKMFVWCTKAVVFCGSLWAAWKFLVKEALAQNHWWR